jgi:hypothetical protein
VEPGQTIDMSNITVGEKLKGDVGDIAETRNIAVGGTGITSVVQYPQTVSVTMTVKKRGNDDYDKYGYFYKNGKQEFRVRNTDRYTSKTSTVSVHLTPTDNVYRSGSVSSCSITYTYDLGYPAINIDKTWGYGQTSVTIYGEDTYAGVKTVVYSLSTSPTTAGTYQTISNGGTVTIDSKGIWYLHMKVTDNAGHVSTRIEGPYIVQ